jgi:hypothetical protein
MYHEDWRPNITRTCFPFFIQKINNASSRQITEEDDINRNRYILTVRKSDLWFPPRDC